MKITPEHNERMANMTFSEVYPHYLTKIKKKGRTKKELHQVIRWLTDFDDKKLQELINKKVTFKVFFHKAKLNPNAQLIKGVICGYRIEEIENPLTKQIRYLDKLVDELAKGKSMEKILLQESLLTYFPKTMGKVALRELAANGIRTFKQITRYTEKELLTIHGVGPKAVRIIKVELDKKNLHLKK